VYGGKNLDTLQHAYKELKDNASFQNALKAQFHILATLDDNDYGNSGDACESNPNKEEAKTCFLNFFMYPETTLVGVEIEERTLAINGRQGFKLSY